MRVIEPSSKSDAAAPPAKKKPHRKRTRLFLVVGLVSIVAAVFGLSRPATAPEMVVPAVSLQEEISGEPALSPDEPVTNFADLSDNTIRLFYDNLIQPNLDRIEVPPVISGNVSADTRIREIAERRGYKLRSTPAIELVSVDGFLLQPAVNEPWQTMQAAALAAGSEMSIVSGYRSVDDQRAIFLQRLGSEAGVTVEQVAAGDADDAVNLVLVESSIPGYSKHHTGYTVDLLCAGWSFENFKNSPCNDWLVADNYANARRYGFLPSYPAEADFQGPDPEAWEYVWVGTEALGEPAL